MTASGKTVRRLNRAAVSRFSILRSVFLPSRATTVPRSCLASVSASSFTLTSSPSSAKSVGGTVMICDRRGSRGTTRQPQGCFCRVPGRGTSPRSLISITRALRRPSQPSPHTSATTRSPWMAPCVSRQSTRRSVPRTFGTPISLRKPPVPSGWPRKVASKLSKGRSPVTWGRGDGGASRRTGARVGARLGLRGAERRAMPSG